MRTLSFLRVSTIFGVFMLILQLHALPPLPRQPFPLPLTVYSPKDCPNILGHPYQLSTYVVIIHITSTIPDPSHNRTPNTEPSLP